MAAGPDGKYGVYWVGKDGNAWVKSNEGHTSNWGKVISNDENGFTYQNGNSGIRRANNWRQIADWSDGQKRVIGQPQGGGYTGYSSRSGGGVSSAELRAQQAEQQKRAMAQANIDNNNASYSRLGGQLQRELDSNNREYESVIDRYNRDRSKQYDRYQSQLKTNEDNLASNKQNAIREARMGRQALQSTLSAMNALSGDGSRLLGEAVRTGFNRDIDQANETAATNVQNTNNSWRDYEEEDRQRRIDARTQLDNNAQALRQKNAAERAKISQAIANSYLELMNQGEANNFNARSRAEADEASALSGKTYSQIADRAITFTPAELEAYLAGHNNTQITADVGQNVNAVRNALYQLAGDDKKREKTAAEKG